ncbi:phosphatidylinositol-specific phospholipase C domain-containing protein [Limnohabitans sp.]|uniref:phosphatidylinositol-specific phospholipase C domain-containing protein n=1 Tax=Limnohabitans sp. TaxID=1907725 RepID=UPI00286EF526|nr:phosphatidylinositol-specific phospholipase C domain-containing protein [Limnohabitans sp.]
MADQGNCPMGETIEGGLCYKPCKSGYTGLAATCWQNCPTGYKDSGAICSSLSTIAKQSYGRGAGQALSCPSGSERNGALCYPQCQSGYYGVGPVCWQSTPEGWTDSGLWFGQWYQYQNGLGWWLWGYRTMSKGSYGRGGGFVPNACNGDLQNGLCYAQCQSGYSGDGPVCYSRCPAGYNDTGALCQKGDTFAKSSYGRTAGSAPAAFGQQNGGLTWDQNAFSTAGSLLTDRSGWMSKIPDGTYISNMTIPGTHDSGMGIYDWNWAMADVVKTQTLQLDAQLYAGIRFLDIRLQLDNTYGLVVSHGGYKAGVTGDEVMRFVKDFLQAHPSEAIIMRVKKELSSDDMTTFAAAADTLLNKYSNILYPKRTSLNSLTLGDLRGRVFIYYDYSFNTNYGEHYNNTGMTIQDNYDICGTTSLYNDKWVKIKESLKSAALNMKNDKSNKIYLSYLNASFPAGCVMIPPYFAASGRPSLNDKTLLSTGLLDYQGNNAGTYADYVRNTCAAGPLCSIYYTGMNSLTSSYIATGVLNNTVGIVVADFPGDSLINNILSLNKYLSKATTVDDELKAIKKAGDYHWIQPVAMKNSSTGRNDYCLKASTSYTLILDTCTASSNELWYIDSSKYDGQSTLLTAETSRGQSTCLDRSGGSYALGTAILAWPCHGAQNQRWYRYADSSKQFETIRPQGRADLCLEYNYVNNVFTTTLQTCNNGDRQKWSLH